VTYSHHSLIQGNRAGTINGLIATLVLAIFFTFLQGVEYSVSSFTISDGVFGSCFYFGTGLTLGAPIIFNITQDINNLSNSFLSKSDKSK
jgi:heme/copper-type cytochrome/quinol oxidase subunit 3